MYTTCGCSYILFYFLAKAVNGNICYFEYVYTVAEVLCRKVHFVICGIVVTVDLLAWQMTWIFLNEIQKLEKSYGY